MIKMSRDIFKLAHPPPPPHTHTHIHKQLHCTLCWAVE